jgi:hypothetical protein
MSIKYYASLAMVMFEVCAAKMPQALPMLYKTAKTPNTEREMFQPRVKLEFVRRYCSPQKGWRVCVDIDASEEGRTGGGRVTEESIRRQEEMQRSAKEVRKGLVELGVQIGSRKAWCDEHGLHYIKGDVDIVAYRDNRCIIAEVEGESSGQPEQKLYKAVGQMVRTVGRLPAGLDCHCVVVVYGEAIRAQLGEMHALDKLGIAGLALGNTDRWLFGTPLHPEPTPELSAR